VSIAFAPPAAAAIQAVFDDPRQSLLAERLEEILDVLEDDPSDIRVRKNRMQQPKFWLVRVYGSGREFAIMWDLGLDGDPYVRWAGDF
jgi:hypothetical protein